MSQSKTLRFDAHPHLIVSHIDDKSITYSCPLHVNTAGEVTEPLSKVAKRKYGCATCGNHFRTKADFMMRNNPDEPLSNKHIAHLSEHFSNKFDYSNFTPASNFETSEIICPEHGAFKASPLEHLLYFGEHGCPECAKTPLSKPKPNIVHVSDDWLGDAKLMLKRRIC